MHADVITVVVRQSEDLFGEVVAEAVTFRSTPVEGEEFDPSDTTAALRAFVLEHGGVRFTVEERRRWADVGASGAGVEYVLELLGAGAVGVTMQAIVDFAKARLGRDHEQWQREEFREASIEDLRDRALTDAERALELARGSLETLEVARTGDSIRLLLRHGERSYRVTRSATGDVWIRQA